MKKILSFIATVSFIFLVIGAFSPATSLFWYPKEPARLTSTLIYGSVIVICFVAFTCSSGNNKMEKRIAVTAENFNDAHELQKREHQVQLKKEAEEEIKEDTNL